MSTTTTTRVRGDRYGPMEWAQIAEAIEMLFRVVHWSEER